MLRDLVAADLELLADHLASSLVGPVADPFAPEMVVVPSVGVRSWLSQRLAHMLGSAGGHDGVTANIAFPLPGRLRRLLLARPDGSPDPWDEGSITWTIHELLLRPPRGLDLGPAGIKPAGATWYQRAARLARLFDHYHVHRPEMIRRWAGKAGHDPSLGVRAWQAALWWTVRERVGRPSPPELLPAALERLRQEGAGPDLPPRLHLFGFSSLTPDLISLVAAAGEGGDVDLYRLRHCPEPSHPLATSWGRQSVTFERLLDRLAPDRQVREPDPPATSPDPPPEGPVLSRLQSDIRRGRPDPPPLGGDGSVQVHGCPGDTRQVEVLRDALLHLLARNPDIDESDIVVLCPDLERFAPLIEGVFGAPASPDGPPRLRYLLSERRPGWSDPMVAAASALLALVGGRHRTSDVLDLLALDAVSRRFSLEPEELETLTGWLRETGVAWGLDTGDRASWGLTGLAQSTFAAGMDRLLTGTVTSPGALEVGPGGVVPRPVPGDRNPLVGTAWAFLATLVRIEQMFGGERTLAAWVEALERATVMVAAPDPDDVDDGDRLGSILSDMVREAEPGSDGDPGVMDLAEFRAAVEARLEPRVGGAYFGTGQVTFASPASLAVVPRAVVCLLGLDDDALPAGDVDGDDLLSLDPREGDRDPRVENRGLLLDALMAARRHLVITYGNHDLARNRPRPPAVPVAELIDLVPGTTGGPVVSHPRHRFDPGNFAPGSPWGFDPGALRAARASLIGVDVARERRRTRQEDRRLDPTIGGGRGSVVDLGGLLRLLRRPSATYLTEAVGVRLSSPGESAPDLIPVAVDALTRWRRDSRLLDLIDESGGHSSPESLISRWRVVERSGGTLPPGPLGEVELDATVERVAPLVAAVVEVLSGPVGERDFVEIELDLAPDQAGDVSTLVGRCGFRPGFGPVRMVAGKEPVDHVLEAWLDLLALTAVRPENDWAALAVCRRDTNGKKSSAVTWHRKVAGDTPGERLATARATLTQLVGIHRTGLLEPLPIFGRTSRLLAQGRLSDARKKWLGHNGSGESNQAEVVAVWGRLDFEDLLALPVLEGDPPGVGGSRVERWAHWLWNLVEASTVAPR